MIKNFKVIHIHKAYMIMLVNYVKMKKNNCKIYTIILGENNKKRIIKIKKNLTSRIIFRIMIQVIYIYISNLFKFFYA